MRVCYECDIITALLIDTFYMYSNHMTYLQAVLGIGACTEAFLWILSCPVGPYYPTGFQAVSLLANTEMVRAHEGGSGSYKVGGYVRILIS